MECKMTTNGNADNLVGQIKALVSEHEACVATIEAAKATIEVARAQKLEIERQVDDLKTALFEAVPAFKPRKPRSDIGKPRKLRSSNIAVEATE
jgi:hypothetical protein